MSYNINDHIGMTTGEQEDRLEELFEELEEKLGPMPEQQKKRDPKVSSL